MWKMNEECGGCVTHDCIDDNNMCIMKCYDAVDKCPCVQCIIKVMCRRDCEEFSKLVKGFKSETPIFSM